MTGLVLLAGVVVFVRTFGFEYFHGGHTAVDELTRLLLGS